MTLLHETNGHVHVFVFDDLGTLQRYLGVLASDPAAPWFSWMDAAKVSAKARGLLQGVGR